MIVKHIYSHLGGLEILKSKGNNLWNEIKDSIESVDFNECMNKKSKEKTMKNKIVLSPSTTNKKIGDNFKLRGWKEKRMNYNVSSDKKVTQHIVSLDNPKDQKDYILSKNLDSISSYHQTDYVKERVAVEVQLGKYSFIEFDLFVKHLYFFKKNEIDVGVEVVPSKKLQKQMSSGPGYYERTLTHILRDGRSNPPLPFILIGFEN